MQGMSPDPDALLNGRLGRMMLSGLAEIDTPWFTDPAELLRPVAAAAGAWAFSSDGMELDRLLRAGAESLRPLAELVVQAPAASWWWEPAAREHQRWLGCTHHPTLARGPAVAAAVQAAAYGGAWWSGPVGDTVWTTRGDLDLHGLPAVGLACAEDAFGEEPFEVWALCADPRARVYEVHAPADWARLAGAYPLDVAGSHEWYRWTGRDGPWIKPDWSAVARDWDGVHVSVGGYLSTAGTAVGSTLLAGWDADQTLWLRDVFSDVRQLSTWQGRPGPDAIP